uniref:HNH domain-containing protein n=1 Tax=Ganoderma boninense TaxID=34458 RepID=A0A5K1JU89_9APHY|nr:Uncharacterized protein [Ganoderma boninense]
MAPSHGQASIESLQFSTFKDCLARRVLAYPGILDHSEAESSSEAGSEADPLDDFTAYLAEEIWPYLPSALHEATYESRDAVPGVDELLLDNLPTAFADTLVSCGIVNAGELAAEEAIAFLRKVLKSYVAETCAPPPMWSKTRTTECEICEREVPLTYHHLIPRAVHDKVRKKKWHPEAMLNSVAWLCRPCHSAVHGVASNEVLAREFFTVDLLLAREDIQRWRKYAAKQRFGVHRG